ncbi:hypothetical protein E2C01_047351 [Portunus trituberculatus]|uniref:Uncharacterized protein n=1 Tax=Portunus trituberculatus TaxID=210409 RepID=A0A5B7G8L4_PORTR|nr:hypothetical protein [Portunus trituberculatus]
MIMFRYTIAFTGGGDGGGGGGGSESLVTEREEQSAYKDEPRTELFNAISWRRTKLQKKMGVSFYR